MKNDLMEMFVLGQIVVHCKTQEDYHNFMTLCDEHGLSWYDGSAFNEPYKPHSPCIRFDGDRLVRDNRHFYEGRCRIIDYGN